MLFYASVRDEEAKFQASLKGSVDSLSISSRLGHEENLDLILSFWNTASCHGSWQESNLREETRDEYS